MINYVNEGRTVTLLAPYQRNSGQAALVGKIFGVATNDVANGVNGEFMTQGVFDITKAAGAVSQGDALFWDDTAKNLTKVGAGNRLVGVATQAQLSGDANARIRLNGTGSGTLFASASLNFPSIAANTSADLTITVTGAAVGDGVVLAPPSAPLAGLTFFGFVSAADTVTVRASNVTVGALDEAALTFGAFVHKS